MKDSVHPSSPPVPPGVSEWQYPLFGNIAVVIRSHITDQPVASENQSNRASMDPGPNPTVYTLEEGFLPKDRKWIENIRDLRMTRASKVLYRPKIVKELVDEIERLFERQHKRGLMVKGPQGVGKSFSLINLTRYLLASGKYWVTVIPDCDKWGTEEDFFKFLLESVGVDPGLWNLHYDAGMDKYFNKLISDIDEVLFENGKKWVFVFDQINKIFARKDYQTITDVSGLPFPFDVMKSLLEPGRRISIISASASNDVSHRENHELFDEFVHEPQFTTNEIMQLYPATQVARWDQDEVKYATGRVPLYLRRWSQDPGEYYDEVRQEIKASLEKLSIEQMSLAWDQTVKSAIECILHLSLNESPLHFDRKFSLVEKKKGSESHKYNVISLFPLVEEVYRNFFWTNNCEYVEEKEETILSICNGPDASVYLRGRLFEQLVIRRLVQSRMSTPDFQQILTDAKVAYENDKLLMAALQGRVEVIRIHGHTFPEFNSLVTNKMSYFIPMSHNFPAVDSFIRLGTTVIAFQIHTSDGHEDVLPALKKRVQRAQWKKDHVRKIILVYLSPDAYVRDEMKKRLGGRAPSPFARYITLFYCIKDFDAFRDLLWN